MVLVIIFIFVLVFYTPIAYVLIVGQYIRLDMENELTVKKILYHLYIEPFVLLYYYLKNEIIKF